MDPLDALWRRDLAAWALGEIGKDLRAKAPRSPIEAMIDAAAMKPTRYGLKMERERNKAIEFNLREIIKCQEALGEDATKDREALEKFLALTRPVRGRDSDAKGKSPRLA